jgi:2-oxoglutarate ferredoxin oxidoreductase subunit beta
VNPDLSIWLITGDGDGLSIGGNHLIHCMRRNVNINILLVNNQIYGLTKGQYSPTSTQGKVTKSSPYGSIDYPINALRIAIASEATFIARTLDSDPNHMGMIMTRAAEHKGISFVEIYQNCIIFNDKAFGPVIGREVRDDRMIYLEEGKPLIYGKQRNKAIKLQGLHPEITDLEGDGSGQDLLIHKEKSSDASYAYLLSQMSYPEMPVPFGVFRAIERPTYDDMLNDQVEAMKKEKGPGDLKKLIYGSSTWTVK